MSETENTEEKVESKSTFTEELEVAGNQVISKVKEIIEQGNVRRIIIRDSKGKVLIDQTLTIGVAAATIITMLGAFPLLVIGGIVGAFAKFKIEIIREVQDGDVVEVENKSKRVEINVEDDEE